MDFKYMLLGASLLVIIAILYILWPILESKRKLHEQKKRQEAFKNKMKELEIK